MEKRERESMNEMRAGVRGEKNGERASVGKQRKKEGRGKNISSETKFSSNFQSILFV